MVLLIWLLMLFTPIWAHRLTSVHDNVPYKETCLVFYRNCRQAEQALHGQRLRSIQAGPVYLCSALFNTDAVRCALQRYTSNTFCLECRVVTPRFFQFKMPDWFLMLYVYKTRQVRNVNKFARTLLSAWVYDKKIKLHPLYCKCVQFIKLNGK